MHGVHERALAHGEGIFAFPIVESLVRVSKLEFRNILPCEAFSDAGMAGGYGVTAVSRPEYSVTYMMPEERS